MDSNDQIELTDSLVTSSTGKMKYTIDLDGLTSGIYRAVVSSLSIQDSVKFSIGLEPGSGSISLISIQETYSPGQSILVLGNTGSNARITITLYDPSRNISSITETFSDDTGNFSTTAIGIPLDGELGTWEIVAHSRLDTKSIDINVTVPTQKGITLDMTDTEFNPGNTIMITGVAQSDASRLTIEITDQNGEIFSLLETPVTAYGTFSLPWLIPGSTETGTYTITVSDTENSASIDVFIQ